MKQSREEIIMSSIKKLDEMQKTADTIFNDLCDELENNDPILRRWAGYSSDLDELCIKYIESFRSLQR